MKALYAKAREAVANLTDSKERSDALNALQAMEPAVQETPTDPLAARAATDALIASLEQDVQRLQRSEEYLLGACKRLQEMLAEARGMKQPTLRAAF